MGQISFWIGASKNKQTLKSSQVKLISKDTDSETVLVNSKLTLEADFTTHPIERPIKISTFFYVALEKAVKN